MTKLRDEHQPFSYLGSLPPRRLRASSSDWASSGAAMLGGHRERALQAMVFTGMVWYNNVSPIVLKHPI